jgi:hypothetical protein
MRSTLAILGFLLLGSAGALVYRSTRAPIERAEAGSSAEDQDKLLREVETLRAEVRALSARRGHEFATRADVAASASAAKVEEHGRPAKLTLKDVVSGLTPQQREVYVHRLQKLQTERRVELAEAELAAEARDQEFQTEVEGEARAAFAALGTDVFPTTRLGSVECGSTLCKIEVDQDSPTEQAIFAGRFNLDRRTFSVQRGADAGDPRHRGWTLFVTKKGHRLPRAELEELVALLPPGSDEWAAQ